MTDGILALLALTTLGVFLGVMVVRVPEVDLAVVLGICFALAAIDFALTLVRRHRRAGSARDTLPDEQDRG